MPPLHTPPAHVVPLGLLLPSAHTALPELQSVVPLRQAEFGLVVQAAPELHALQLPMLQTPPGHVVPLGFAAPSPQTGTPVEHAMAPFRQMLGLVVQAAPDEQGLQLPMLHTPPAQVVPFALLLPSLHTATPVAQLVMPFRQAELALVVHAAPSLQGLHMPMLQTPPVHTVPLVLLLPSTQTGAPELHSVVPLRQAALGLVVQAAPCVQETHWSSALHTWVVPQEAPVPLRLPLVQTGAPEVQEMVPLKHGLVGAQVAPALQAMHMPAASHTWPIPHVVPGALLPPSMQRSAPVLQSVTPFLQRPGLVAQVAPALQITHAPMPLQTRPAPQVVPAATLPLSTQTELPELQSVRPATHGAPGLVVHTWLATHMPQLPFESHTWPEPHAVPAALLLPSTQVVAPVAHEVRPLRHAGLGLVVHATFAVQVTQLPLTLHTWLVPHVVPAGRLPESMHVCAPVVHEVTPVLHPGLGFVVHAVPATHATQEPFALHT